MEIRPIGAALMQADGRTEGERHRHDEGNRHFSGFGERA